MSLTFSVLDAADPGQLVDYERAFYSAFAGVAGNTLIRDLWLWDDANGRLATRIPYEDQTIFVGRNERGGIETAMAYNHAMRDFQGAAFGFAPPQPVAGRCELIVFFTLGHRQLSRATENVIASYAGMRRRGYHTAYATTAARPLVTYRRMGGVVLEEREVRGEMRYFLEFDLARFQGREAAGRHPEPEAPGSL